MKNKLVVGQRVKLKNQTWFNKNKNSGNNILFGWNNYKKLTEQEYSKIKDKIFYVLKIETDYIDVRLTDKNLKPIFRNDIYLPLNSLNILKGWETTNEQQIAIETLLSKFDRAFVEQGGPGGGRGKLINLTKENVVPCFTENGVKAISIPGELNPYKCPIIDLHKFIESKVYTNSWDATEYSRINEKITLLIPGEEHTQKDYNWTSR